jgi:hypothetical protein
MQWHAKLLVQVVIRFTPDSLADYDDEFVVDTAENRFSVALKARRPPPALTLPPELHVGEVVCGNRKVSESPDHHHHHHHICIITRHLAAQ